MSKALVTQAEAVNHLRIDQVDQILPVYIEAASEAVLNYLKAGADPYLDTAGDVISDDSGPIGIPGVIKAATLIMLATIYDDARSGSTGTIFDEGALPLAVKALLYPLRDPALA